MASCKIILEEIFLQTVTNVLRQYRKQIFHILTASVPPLFKILLFYELFGLKFNSNPK